MTGRTISHYRILEKLGEGGMGVVYKAQDTRLNRTVAIKVLPPDKLSDAQARERFEREARAISSLNHPNICTLYDFAHEDGVDSLVMEYVDGNPLQGPMPLEKTLRLGAQIADALDHAHRNGIVHRDLKPGNILATKAGVKLLDFGLAKFSHGPERSGEQEVTLTRAITQDGTILGTFHYMSPEQWEGKEADCRSDIFAFGAVLFEMLTGRKAFEGRSQASLIGAILKDDPPSMSSLGLITPPGLDYIVKTCMAKDPDDRWQSARDLSRELRRVSSGDAVLDAVPVAASLKRRRMWNRPAYLVVAALVLLVLASLLTWNLARSALASRTRVIRSSITVRDVNLTSINGSSLAFSPDGMKLAFVGERGGVQQAFLRTLDSLTVAPIPGTEGADTLLTFSPDGESVLIGTNAGTGIKRVSVAGGPAIDIFEGGHVWSADWGPDGTIVFTLNDAGLVEVSADGGEVTPLIGPKADESFLWPTVLPGGDAVVFSASTQDSRGGQIAVVSRVTGEMRYLFEGTCPRFLPTGHLVFVRNESLWAVPFDTETLEVTGSSAPLGEDIDVADWGLANYDVSEEGSLVYLATGGDAGAPRAFVWVDREGQEEVITTGLVDPRVPRISPDGTRIAYDAFASRGGNDRDIWIYDLVRKATTRFTFQPTFDAHPVWSPDGQQIVYLGGAWGIFRKSADGTGATERLTTSRVAQPPTEFLPDGSGVVFYEIASDTSRDIYSLALDGPNQITPLLRTSAVEASGSVSPDGRWLAYESNESGSFEVYVRPFPNIDDGRWQVSSGGGTEPRWARNGQELFYRNGARMMRVPVTLEPVFVFGHAEVLFEGNFRSFVTRNYDVAADDQRFLMIKDVATDATTVPLTEFVFIQNWMEEVSGRAPVD
jgi:eukaryotic-like serine/threonine-protein kinase